MNWMRTVLLVVTIRYTCAGFSIYTVVVIVKTVVAKKAMLCCSVVMQMNDFAQQANDYNLHHAFCRPSFVNFSSGTANGNL